VAAVTERLRPGRPSERGATLFVVVLAITLLTGVGLYTVHSASLSARAAGSGREALQAGRVTEVHAVATLTELRLNAAPQLEQYYTANETQPDVCEMNSGLPGTPRCRQIPLAEIAPISGAPMLALDSLGPLGTMSGGARMELTDVYASPIPVEGADQNDSSTSYHLGTLTVIGRIDPAGLGGACVENQMQVSAQHIIRTQLMLGPL
jgi:hypothetical protein